MDTVLDKIRFSFQSFSLPPFSLLAITTNLMCLFCLTFHTRVAKLSKEIKLLTLNLPALKTSS